MALSQEARDGLLRTKELFASTHWARGAMRSTEVGTGKPRYCAVGGMRKVLRGDAYAADLKDDVYLEALQAVVSVIHPHYVSDVEAARLLTTRFESLVVEWNDRLAGGVDDVVDVFERAASL